MTAIRIALQVIRGAAKGALMAFAAVIIFISIMALPAGGPLVALYYAGSIFFSITPIGCVAGALWTCVVLYNRPAMQPGEKSKNDQRPSRLAYVIGVGLSLPLVVAVALIPHFNVDVDDTVTHAAMWTTSPTGTGGHICDTDVIILVLTEYDTAETICSPALLASLEASGEIVIPVTYRVTRDFGDPRSYQLINAGGFALTWDDWDSGASGGCHKYNLPCDDSLRKRESILVESSWPQSQ